MDPHTSQDVRAGADWQPRPSYDRLALHRWEMGQVLHPAQFRAQEEALLEHVGLRVQLAGLPSRGVALLRWDNAQLASGDLSISALTVVLPSGRLIDVPGNAVLTPRKLVVPARAAAPVPVYLHLRGELRPDGARDLPRYEADEPEIRRAVYQVEISAEPGIEGEQERMKLAELSFSDGAWALAPYVPPLVRLGSGTTPFLRDTMAQIGAALGGFESELVRRAADSVTGAEPMSEVRRMLTALYRVQAVLADHGYGAATQAVALHPYHLFAALREFYLEAVVLQGKPLEDWPPRYQHDDLRGCFEQLARGLGKTLSVPAVVSPRLPFHRDEHWFVTGPFPDELRRARGVFLLLERAFEAPGAERAAPPMLDDLKLASPLRAEEVYTKALEGVPRQAIPSLGFAQTFGHRATVFQLDATSPEWRQAVVERALCFAVLPGLENYHAALFWQGPDHG
ncbi:MAG TPA: type VI secretion system baseplate subunit TssK [Kofleriaceae bacterium]|nr:type VI secretion system baseplate subunit TssK [Kofleriaceae bacterium]